MDIANEFFARYTGQKNIHFYEVIRFVFSKAKEFQKGEDKNKVVKECLTVIARGFDGKENTEDDIFSQETLQKIFVVLGNDLVDDFLLAFEDVSHANYLSDNVKTACAKCTTRSCVTCFPKLFQSRKRYPEPSLSEGDSSVKNPDRL